MELGHHLSQWEIQVWEKALHILRPEIIFLGSLHQRELSWGLRGVSHPQSPLSSEVAEQVAPGTGALGLFQVCRWALSVGSLPTPCISPCESSRSVRALKVHKRTLGKASSNGICLFKGLLRVTNIDLEKSRSVYVPRKTSLREKPDCYWSIRLFFLRDSVSATKTLRGPSH